MITQQMLRETHPLVSVFDDEGKPCAFCTRCFLVAGAGLHILPPCRDPDAPAPEKSS